LDERRSAGLWESRKLLDVGGGNGDLVVAENVIVVRFEEESKAYRAFSVLKQTDAEDELLHRMGGLGSYERTRPRDTSYCAAPRGRRAGSKLSHCFVR
jgi:hypothetical protein